MRGQQDRAVRLAAGLVSMAVCAAAAAVSPAAHFRHYTVADGLSQSSVTALLQDAHGFIWIGTQDGLNRFDGHEFRRFGLGQQGHGGLADMHVTALAADNADTVWVGTLTGGLSRLDTRSGEVQACVAADPAISSTISAVLVDRGGGVWAGGPTGLLVVRASNDACRVDRYESGPETVTTLAGGPGDSLWAGTAAGSIWVRAGPGADFLRLVNQPAAARPITALAAVDSGVWIGADGPELTLLNLAGEVLAQHQLDGRGGRAARVRGLAQGSGGTLWVTGIDVGLAAIGHDSFDSWRHSATDRLTLASDDTTIVLPDRSGSLWIGHRGSGLDTLYLPAPGFRHFRHQPEDPQALSHDMVTAFAPAGEARAWVGTDGGGLDLLDLSSGVVATQRHDPARPDSLSSDRVWAVHVDRAGRLWAGTWGGGLNFSDDGGATFRQAERVIAGPEPGRVILAIAESDDGTLWFGSADRGLTRLAAGADRFERFVHDPADPATLSDDNITALLVDDAGFLWVGTWLAGLNRLDPATGQVTRYRRVTGSTASLPHDTVRSLAKDAAGRLWVGTAAGLAALDPATGQFTSLRDSWSAGTVYSILPDAAGDLWLGTNRGLARLDPVSGVVRVFEPSEGVQAYEFNGNAAADIGDGWFLFGGIRGLNAFRPLEVAINPSAPGVTITQLAIDGEVLPLPASAAALVLPHEQNTIDLRFTALHFANPARNRYAYRLLGLDDEWRNADANNRAVTYTELPPGQYRFEVRAASVDGIWSTQPAALDLRITPPWWQTPVALAGWLVAALLLAYGTIQWRTLTLRQRARQLGERVRDSTLQITEQKRTIERQADHLQQLLDAKQRLFAQVSHEFRTPLTLILGPAGEALRSRPPVLGEPALRLVHSNAERLLRLVDRLLDLARLSADRREPLGPVSISRTTALVAASFDSLAADRGITLETAIDDDVWARGTVDALEAIVSNLLSNAIKFTPPGGQVRVELRGEAGEVVLVVKDTGPGVREADRERIFEAFERADISAPGTGIGLAVVREAVTALGGRIEVADSLPAGAAFTVRLPACPPAADAPAPTAPVAAAIRAAGAVQTADSGWIPPVPDSPSHGRADEAVILIVEDHAELRRWIVQLLTPEFSCVEADSAEAGLVMARECVPDLVITDLMLPGEDGFTLTRELKADARTSHVPIVMLTAREGRESRLRGLEERADDYLTKPFDPAELRLRVRNLIETRSIIRQQAARTPATVPGAGEASADAHPLGPREQRFLDQLAGVVEARLSDSNFGVAETACALAMSERQLQRKLRALLDMRPADYLRERRLQHAARLLAEGEPAAAAAWRSGFASPAHFGLVFKARFGTTPGDFARAGARK